MVKSTSAARAIARRCKTYANKSDSVALLVLLQDYSYGIRRTTNDIDYRNRIEEGLAGQDVSAQGIVVKTGSTYELKPPSSYLGFRSNSSSFFMYLAARKHSLVFSVTP